MNTHNLKQTIFTASFLLALALLSLLLIPYIAASKDAQSSQPNSSTITDTTIISGTFQGTVAITVPVPLGVLDFAFSLEDQGGVLSGTMNNEYTLVFDGTPNLRGSVDTTPMTPTFTLASEPFSGQVSGRQVERSFTLDGEAVENGEVLQGIYTEVITGFTPKPMVITGLFMLTRPPDAPEETTLLTLSVNESLIATAYGQAIASASVVDQNGQPLSGVEVTFSAELGSMSPASATTNANGRAISTFSAGDMPGLARITADCCDGLSQSVNVKLESPVPNGFTLQVAESTLDTGVQTVITATVRDQFDSPMSGASVTLQATLGTVSPSSAVTDENGQVNATFSAGNSSGNATITALAGTATDSATIEITDSNSSVSIPLVTGWNLISIPVQPDSSAITDVLAAIEGNYTLVRSYDSCDTNDPWKTYDPSAPPFANDLTNINASLALWIKMSNDDTLELTGQVTTNPTISLCTGWNLVAYPSIQAQNVSDALESINGAYTLVRSYNASDTSDPWKTYDPSAPPFANDLTQMQPGLGYWINANQDVTWTID